MRGWKVLPHTQQVAGGRSVGVGGVVVIGVGFYQRTARAGDVFAAIQARRPAGQSVRGNSVKTFVRKKSTRTTMMLTLTTVRVVARPTPSVP